MSECSDPDCTRPAHTRHLCSTHYSAHWTAGTLDQHERMAPHGDAVTCTCDDPNIDGLGACRTCKRLIITDIVLTRILCRCNDPVRC